ncbi:MAG: class I SAM-dependent methyltransferase [Patescibacteria group bacterium]
MLKTPQQKVLYLKQQYFYPAIADLKGRVLEIGFGKGRSLAYYSDKCEIFLLEKSDKKIRLAKKNRDGEYKNIEFFKGEAESLSFEDNFFDAVVVSFVLCSVISLETAIKEIERVLRPGGKLILLEHVKSDNKVIGRIQEIFAKPYSLIFKNCHPNRNPLLFISKNVFDLSIEIKTPYILGKLIFVEAHKKIMGREGS